MPEWMRRATEQVAHRSGSAIGGLLNVIYGNIPEVGDVAVLDNYEFRVLKRSRRSVELVQLRVTTEAEREEQEDEGLQAL